MPPIVYIAGPFRGRNSWDMEQNIRRAEALALDVWKMGAAAVCPHANTRFFQGAAADDVWLTGDLAILRRCDAVLMTADWRDSEGAIAEHGYALERGVEVFYGLDELRHWVYWRFGKKE